MKTNYHEDLIAYYKNWKPGMGPYWGPDRVDKVEKLEVEEESVADIVLRYMADDILDNIKDII